MSYYALGIVVVVEADNAEEAYEKVNPPSDGANLSADGEAYVGAVYSTNACPITPEAAGDPDWNVKLYHASDVPLVEGDE